MARSKALKAAQEKYLSGKPKPISFRLDGEPRDKLREQQQHVESENQTARRLLLEMLAKI
jgi:hypothetical protein